MRPPVPPVLCLLFLATALSLAAQDDAQRAKDALIVRTLLRLPGIDLAAKPEAKAALLRHLDTLKGTEQYVEIAGKFQLREISSELLRLAVDDANAALGVRAAGLLVKLGERERIAQAIADPDSPKAARLVAALGLLADAKTNDWLAPLVTDKEKPLAVRSAAVTGLARNAPGQKRLLALVEAGQLAEDCKFAAANGLLSSPDDAIRAAAGKHLSLPAAAGGEPLPPIAELVKRRGDVARGKELFAGAVAACAKCHKVKGEGKEVGPDLSEIGAKLSKEALYLSILDPSAGVSFNYETWLVRDFSGTVLTGVLVSQTDAEVELKTSEAIIHKLKKADIEQMKKSATSLMPADIQKQLKAQDLVDLVEYLATLKKEP